MSTSVNVGQQQLEIGFLYSSGKLEKRQASQLNAVYNRCTTSHKAELDSGQKVLSDG